jgi:hypothetical protein
MIGSFTLTSYEPTGAYQPKLLDLRQRVSCGNRDDYFWAEVSPPFAREELCCEESLSTVLLAPRLAGDRIEEGAAWPMHVYICRTKASTEGAPRVPVEDVDILNWGLIEPRSNNDTVLSKEQEGGHE